MVFAAGLGTRLRPLTNDRPKALVEVNGKPLLQIALERLRLAGVRQVIVNVHYLAEQIIRFLEQPQFADLHIAISDESDLLLDTGGGLKKASWFFADGQPFILYNADVVTNLDLESMYAAHLRSGALATLAVRDRPSSRFFLFDEQQRLCGWQNTGTGQQRLSREVTSFYPLAFSGVHVISPTFFEYMPDEAVFSILESYLRAAATETILAWRHDADIWIDVGKPEELARAQELYPWA